jgi:hypothetical protein
VKSVIARIILFGLFTGANGLHAGDKDKAAEKLESKTVDSGSFGLYIGGKRIGTESFKIEQHSDYSVASAQLKVDDGNVQAAQSAEMRVGPNGDLKSYSWHATLPRVEEASVEPRDQLLVEHIVPADQKKMDVPHILPLSTVILDNNFFSQREVLLWRYLATACVWKQKDGQGLLCGPGNFAILVPQQHLSASAIVEVIGVDKVMVKGTERQLNKIALRIGDPKQLVLMNGQSEAESGQWLLWADDNYKIIKITVSGSNFEVVRD